MAEVLWRPGPDRIAKAQITALAARFGFTDEDAVARLWRHSVEDLAGFWQANPLLRILCEQPAIWTVPLAIGLIDLEEGTRLVADLVGIEPDDIEIGMAVELEWADHDPDLSLPQFHPVTAGGA